MRSGYSRCLCSQAAGIAGELGLLIPIDCISHQGDQQNVKDREESKPHLANHGGMVLYLDHSGVGPGVTSHSSVDTEIASFKEGIEVGWGWG